MKKILVRCSFGYANAYHEEIMEFEDNVTEDEISDSVWDWATQFIEVEWENAE